MNTIVVAVDGSAESGAALRFAISEAGLRWTRVLLICPWEVPVSLFSGSASRAVDPRSFEQTAEQTIENALTEARRLDPDIPCEATGLVSALIGRATDVCCGWRIPAAPRSRASWQLAHARAGKTAGQSAGL